MSPEGAVELESVWTEAGGYRIHARAAASPQARSRSVVLVHGLVVSSRYMIPTAKRLAIHRPVLAPDLPGFGRSEKARRALDVPELADTLAAWIRARGLERPILLANSFGCQVVADLAVRYPDDVSALVLIGPTVDPGARSALRQIGRFLRLAWKEPPSYWPVLALDFMQAGVGRTWLTFRHMLRNRIELALPRIRVPALVVRGARDPIVSQAWAEKAARLLPAGGLAVIPGAAHIVNYDAAAALAETIGPFLDACDAGP